MADKKFKIPKRDAERARRVLEYEKKTEPKYKTPGSAGSCLMLLIALAIAGAGVFYVLTHRDKFAHLWQRTTKPDAMPTETGPDQGY